MARSTAAWFAKKDEQSARMAAKAPEKKKKLWEAHIKRTYGLTLADYEALYDAQGGACAICKCTIDCPKQGDYLHIDHDHKTEVVRGLLCSNCNSGIGMLGDTAESVMEALAYLDKELHIH